LGLILEVAREPYPEYIFRQALTQETAYFTILLKNRRTFHRMVGEALLQLYGDRVEEFAALLGYHFYHAQDQRAFQFFKIEGDAAFRLYANQEAVNYYSQAIEVALWEQEPDLDEIGKLYISRGRSFELNSRFTEALENYVEMENLGAQFGDDALVLSALIARAQILSIPSDHFDLETGLDLLNRAQKIAEEQNDQAALAKTYWIMTNLYRFHVNLKEAQQLGEMAISLARDLGLEEQLAYSLTDVAHTYNMDGRVDRAREVSLEAVELWKKLGNQPMLADSLGGLAMINTLAGEFDQAYKYSDEAYEISLKIDNLWGQAYSRGSIGLVDYERGDVDLAVSRLEQSRVDAAASQFMAGVVLTSSFLALLYADLGADQLALETVENLVDEIRGKMEISKTFYFGALLLVYTKTEKVAEVEALLEAQKSILEDMNLFARQHYLMAKCYMPFQQGDYESTIRACGAALDFLQGTGVRFYTPELLLLAGKAHLALDDLEAAQVSFEEAHQVAEGQSSQRSLWQVYYYLGVCENHLGNPAAAASYFSKSRATLQYILSKISDQALKDHFLDRTEVKEVLATAVEEAV
jgi:tetratricopeptide (TPR) repeat protein